MDRIHIDPIVDLIDERFSLRQLRTRSRVQILVWM